MRALGGAPDDPGILLLLGQIHIRDGAWDAAETVLARAAALRPDTPSILQWQGTLLQARGQKQEALGLFRRVLELEPTHQDACIAIAGIRRDAEGPNAAISFLDSVLARHPDLGRVAEIRDRYRHKHTDT